MVHLLYRAILIYHHADTTQMVLLVIVISWLEVGIEGAITSLEEILVQLSILEDEIAGIEVLRSLVGSVLEVERAIIKQAANLVADRLYLVAIVLVRLVVYETKGIIVSLAISLQLLNGTIRGIRQDILGVSLLVLVHAAALGIMGAGQAAEVAIEARLFAIIFHISSTFYPLP